tara:strand:+ start:7502 stop:8119 length:618 start_codon:yes stop_codon:yes gene_type:complete
MPIIKDKYGARGSQTRSKFITRKENSAIQDQAPVGLSTAQKEEINKQNYRASAEGQKTSSISPPTSQISDSVGAAVQKNFKINYTSLSSINTVTELFKLIKGDSLQDIVIHNYHSSGVTTSNNIISIYWSAGDQSNGTFTVSGGFVTAFTGINMVRLFGAQFPHLATISLKDALSNTFQNVSKDIYFYGVVSIAGPDITYAKTSG